MFFLKYHQYCSTMYKSILTSSLILLSTLTLSAQQVIPLYSGAIPHAKTTPSTYVEKSSYGKDSTLLLAQVSQPTLTVFKAAKPNGSAVIICPGGGYSILAIEKEGYKVAQRFQQIGVTAFVLKYRLPNDLIMENKSFGPLQDAQQAIYLVRKQASQWGIAPNRIGIMGFSAGGHLASSLCTHYTDSKINNKEQISLRPDFSILIYPVINFDSLSHRGSVNKLLGTHPEPKQQLYFSSEFQVGAQTPPAFLVHANNDKTVVPQNSIRYNEALVSNGIAAELHLYQAGGHGFGLYNKSTSDDWFERLSNWLKSNQF